ncbi:hypothetical protein FRC04_005388 [Tulasnella sp. 424]|nr:hypothetical protein FRC04_005388 [Tulasnella sp. 424]KAG8964776.1 hypothetical protein FRC05_003566 [Tulasnella sp. 425]
MSDETGSMSDDQPSLSIKPSPRHINDLPYDVFHLIFSICCEASKTGVPFQVLASHVCRTWRQHAINTPSFWTKLEFRQKKPRFEKYQVWLERTNGAPFDVSIDQGPFHGASVKHAKEIMRLIVPNIARLRRLEVLTAPPKIMRIIFDRLARVSAPQLRKLTVRAERDSWWSEPAKQTKWKFQPFVQGEAPSLRELNLYGIDPSHVIGRFKDLRYVRIKWSGIFGTPNPMAYDHAKSVQVLLNALPDLQYLLVDDGGYKKYYTDTNDFHQVPAQLPPPTTHDALKHISIASSPANINAIITSLILPKLRYAIDRQQTELVIGVGCLGAMAQSDPSPYSGLLSLRLGGGCSVSDKITHPQNSINMGYLEPALARLKHLRSLTFERVDFEDDQYLPCLGWTSHKLEWLRLVNCRGFTLKQVRSTVEARLQAKKKIQPLVRLIIIHERLEECSLPCEEADKEWLESAVQLVIKNCIYESIPGEDYLSVVKGMRPLRYV